MGKRVVFAGGVQAKALAKAYRLDVAADRDEDVFFIPGEAMSRDAAHRVVAAADVLVTVGRPRIGVHAPCPTGPDGAARPGAPDGGARH